MDLPVVSRLMRAQAVRWRMAVLGGLAALALAGCTGDESPSVAAKAMKSLSPQTLALISEKGMTKDSPIVVRIFKEESELEVWKQTTSGDYALLKTYPICRWSGELGPKTREGDRQAPEGFYTITPGQMNPNSSYYLSFDLGYPNAYDRAWGRSGSNLMVHGDCSSRGCYAMTDEQIQEIFALGRESFRGGQRSFQVQAYPFRMTAENMVRHRNNPNLAFWQMLKEGSDTFEITKAQPKVDVCGKRYVFDATPVDPSQTFRASEACPAYTQPDGLAAAVAQRQQEVATRIASAGSFTPVAPIKTGKDGGMHKVFLAKLENPELSAPGSLPPVVKPPGSDYGVATNEPAPAESIALATADAVPTAADVPLPAPRPADAPGVQVARTPGAPSRAAQAAGTQVAAAGAETTLFGASAPAAAAPRAQVASLEGGGSVGGGFMDSVRSFFGRGSDPATQPTALPAPTTAEEAGFSFSRLLGRGPSSAPAAQPAAVQPAEVPVPPVRPAVPPQAARPAAAQSSAPSPTRAAAMPARPAPPAAQAQSRPQPPTAQAAAARAPVVPLPAQAAAAAYYQSLPASAPAGGGASSPAGGTSSAASASAPALRPSVAAGQEPLYGSFGSSATILTPGSFSSSVQ